MPTRLGLVVSLGLVLSTAASVSAHAAAEDDVTKRAGTCNRDVSSWRLRVIDDGGVLEVAARIDGGRPDERFDWELRHDGERSFSGSRETRDATGAFTVVRRMVDHIGVDDIVLRAVNTDSGEVCWGRARV